MSSSDRSASQGDTDAYLSPYEEANSEFSTDHDTSSSESESESSSDSQYLTLGSGSYPNVGGSNEAGTSNSRNGKAPIFEGSSEEETFTSLLERIDRNTSQQTRDYLTPSSTMPNSLPERTGHDWKGKGIDESSGMSSSTNPLGIASWNTGFSSFAGPSSSPFLASSNHERGLGFSNWGMNLASQPSTSTYYNNVSRQSTSRYAPYTVNRPLSFRNQNALPVPTSYPGPSNATTPSTKYGISSLPENTIPSGHSYCPFHGRMPPQSHLEQYPYHPTPLWNDYSGTDTSFAPIFHSWWLYPPRPNTPILPPLPNTTFPPLHSPSTSPWASGLTAGHNQQGVTQLNSDPRAELSLQPPTHQDPYAVESRESRIARGRRWMRAQVLHINNNNRGNLRLPATSYVTSEEDRFDDMRLDIDDMSYEELLELEEQIGQVGTGLNDSEITTYLRRRTVGSSSAGAYMQAEPCCVCREMYVADDEMGILDCKHEFHAACIHEWLKRQNKCPICKKMGLDCKKG